MEFRYLGNSGFKISAISYGNWITHGSQVEEDAANACVKRALDLGITTFDTADVYAGTRAEEVLTRARTKGSVYFESATIFDVVACDRTRSDTCFTRRRHVPNCLVADGTGHLERQIFARSTTTGWLTADASAKVKADC